MLLFLVVGFFFSPGLQLFRVASLYIIYTVYIFTVYVYGIYI
nr:MAG TPA: hypothetical protein [Bacteriophage sp.]